MISVLSVAANMDSWAVVLSIALCTLGLAVYFLFLYRPWAGPRTRYPVLLVHGVFGFDEIEIGAKTHQYFRGIPEYLSRLGVEVHVYQGLMTSTIPERAMRLAKYLRNMQAKKVNIIAHSMGGLDARYAISKLNCSDKVASLTTIGTPHRGSPVADFGDALLRRLGLLKLVQSLKDPLGAMSSLTTQSLEEFNRTIHDVSGVYYASVICAIDSQIVLPHPLLIPTNHQIEKTHGPNDGMVPESSQKWGNALDRICVDHWGEVGWSNHFDANPVYRNILLHLRKKGL